MLGHEVRALLKSIWPSLRQIWLWDSKGYKTFSSLQELRQLVEDVRNTKLVLPSGEEVYFRDLQNVGEQFDCDDLAAGGEFLAKLLWLFRARGSPPIAFGKSAGDKFQGFTEGHKLDFAIVNSEIYLVDFDRGGEIWKADSERDSVFFVSM